MSAVAAPAAVMLPAPRRAVDDADAVAVLPELWVPEASQWLSSSAGRMALEGYSWMQAVHWVAGSGLYQPRRHRSSGLRSFNATTVFIAQLLAELNPCFPGIEYLMRRTRLSKRIVNYHLAALRETGLLAYISKGTRVRGARAEASEFARMIPVEFDVALGIRTVLRDEAAPAYTRAVTGIAEAGRELMAKLGRKASRKLRRPRPKAPSKALLAGARAGADGVAGTAVSAGSRCTPMGGGAVGSSTAGITSLPPESKLASGESKLATRRKSKAKAAGRGSSGRQKLNAIGRRYQLGRELTEQVEWLRGCSVPRIAWVAQNVADAGWTATEVLAWLHLRGTAEKVYRGSGLLAVLLANAENVLDSPAKRADAVAQWRGAQEAQRRHDIEKVRAGRERYEGDWHLPESCAVHSEMDSAVAQLRSASRAVVQDLVDDAEGAGVTSYEVDDQELADIRAAAQAGLETGDTTLINDTVHGCGLEEAVRVYGEDLIRRAHQLDRFRRSSLSTYSYGA
ncbi:transcriptional regulator [Streptomyces sp. SR27]|uniref:transcriptional regulator n=1 Tax=Streptomyces sp. SR27 TaxID=3076630 RepID=UPI00295AB2F0|nr:transcriptional regulator [Streptomyces sp. SR27]MDV9189768.1 transcriptional regulator [Streptomyces sp. SR27]